MKKIAFILFGQVKNYNEIQHAQFKKLIKPSLSNFSVDYFLITSKSSSYHSERQAGIEPTNSPIDYKSINNFFNFTNIFYDDLHNDFTTKELFNFSNYLVRNFKNHEHEAWGKYSESSTFNSLKQLYSLNYFFNFFKMHINDYDGFILARSDIFYTHHLTLPNLYEKGIFLPSFGHYPAPGGGEGCNDRFCIITCQNILELYCTRLSLLKDKPEFYHAEMYLNQTLIRSGLIFKQLNNFKFRLLRSNNIITTPSGFGKSVHLTNRFFKK